jgi:hypothetical protein
MNVKTLAKVTEDLEAVVTARLEQEGSVKCCDVLSIWLNLSCAILKPCMGSEECKEGIIHFSDIIMLQALAEETMARGHEDEALQMMTKISQLMGGKGNVTMVCESGGNNVIRGEG